MPGNWMLGTRARLMPLSERLNPPADLSASWSTPQEPPPNTSFPAPPAPDDLWDKILDTNLTGAFRMIRAVLPGIIGRKWGRIFNIGSTAATVGR